METNIIFVQQTDGLWTATIRQLRATIVGVGENNTQEYVVRKAHEIIRAQQKARDREEGKLARHAKWFGLGAVN